jgi:hypothetical protein
LKNPLTRSLISTASILAFASVVAAQNPQTESQSGSSLSGFLNNARYEFGRGLTFSSADGGNSMSVGGQVQAGYSWADDGDNSVNSSFNSQARLRVHGSVMDGKASYFVQMNPSGGGQNNGNLVDAWVGWSLADSINLRLGQQKMRSGLSADTSANDTDFETVTRSGATNFFANGRATGALIEGHGMDGRFNWHFGVANDGTANGNGQGNDDTDMMITAGASFGSHAGNSESWSEGDLARSGEMQWITGATVTANNGLADNTQTINVFGGIKAGNGIAAQFDYWTRDLDAADTTDDGFSVQASYTMAKSGSMQPGFVLRHSNISIDGAADDLTETVIGVNAYYADHNLKTQLQVSSFDDGSSDDATSIDLLFTLVF